MQYGRDVKFLIREVVIVDPVLGTVHVLKADVRNGFYRIGLQPMDAPKMGLVFPSEGEDEKLVAIMLTLPMTWKNAPPIFCTAKETVADIENSALRCNKPALPHRLDDMTEAIIR